MNDKEAVCVKEYKWETEWISFSVAAIQNDGYIK